MNQYEQYFVFLPEDVVDQLKNEENKTVLMGWIDKVNRHNIGQSRFIILTNYELFLYQKEKFKNVVQEKLHINWFDVKSIDVSKDPILTIKYGEPNEEEDQNKYMLRLKGDLLHSILEKLDAIFLGGFTEEERPEITYDPTIPRKDVNKNQLLLRMQLQLWKIGFQLSYEAKKAIFDFFSASPDMFKLDQIIHIVDFLPQFLSSLSFKPSITKIIVPNATKLHINIDGKERLADPIEVIGSFLKTNKFVTSLTFEGKMPVTFRNFVNDYCQTPSLPITELIFKNCEFQVSQKDDFSRMISYHPVETLHIISCLAENVVIPFFSIFSSPGFEQIKTLTIDGSYGVDIENLMGSLGNVEELSMVDCNIELSEFFVSLSKLRECKLQRLTLNSNKNVQIIPDGVVIPNNLLNIRLSNIAWEEDSFIKLFSLLAESSTAMYDFSKARMSKASWERFFMTVSRKKSNQLKEFIWSENPIHVSLFKFLLKCPVLQTLVINGCLTDEPQDKENRLYLKDMIKKSKTLQVLSIRGTPRKHLGKVGIATILSAIAESQNLRRLGIRKHHVGPVLLHFLAECLSTNKSLQFAAIDGNDILDLSAYTEFFDEIRSKHRKFVIEWPEEEMRDILQFGDADEGEIEIAKQKHAKMMEGDSSVVRLAPSQQKQQQQQQRKRMNKSEKIVKLSELREEGNLADDEQTTRRDSTSEKSPRKSDAKTEKTSKISDTKSEKIPRKSDAKSDKSTKKPDTKSDKLLPSKSQTIQKLKQDKQDDDKKRRKSEVQIKDDKKSDKDKKHDEKKEKHKKEEIEEKPIDKKKKDKEDKNKRSKSSDQKHKDEIVEQKSDKKKNKSDKDDKSKRSKSTDPKIKEKTDKKNEKTDKNKKDKSDKEKPRKSSVVYDENDKRKRDKSEDKKKQKIPEEQRRKSKTLDPDDYRSEKKEDNKRSKTPINEKKKRNYDNDDSNEEERTRSSFYDDEREERRRRAKYIDEDDDEAAFDTLEKMQNKQRRKRMKEMENESNEKPKKNKKV
ncbi:hypothetical protein TVAG_079350 [Trichomonas vaginalis G3]|uniref:Leucine Rich Repeat family protein n=1 Tax=Trichomonas vaginalis (strain ATCC PRA-98 / G3) TaxID=412133 RepID=A2EF67_TRIV3|nr:leucine-rich repeat, isoform f-related family [Trichomonas vaginalis G3]EAY08677.1 hypothetical protein TVAG_079350 [Trichomonas vaginalis G3]KAI5492794.1 leucine-rich repeat, isoform f-related family [Trichomonas vaginalis G3]|eukprot:XP_001320900.1 hypothetical protein [Trichomonas vaginalis G3]